MLLSTSSTAFPATATIAPTYKRELKKSGVTMMSVLENLDDSPESIILESVLEGLSEYYSKNLAREVMKGMRESAMECRYVGGFIPYGFR